MKRQLIQFLIPIFGLIFLSCESDDDSAKIPPAMLQRVNEIESCSCNPELQKYFWHGRVVYTISTVNSLCMSVFVLYDSNGNEIPLPEGYDYGDFLENSLFLGVLWKCEE